MVRHRRNNVQRSRGRGHVIWSGRGHWILVLPIFYVILSNFNIFTNKMTKIINLPLSNRPLCFWTERSEMLDVVVDVASKPEFPSKSGSWKVQPSHQFVQGPGDGSVAMVQGVESTKLVVVHNSSFWSENVLLYWRILEIRRRTCWAISAREYFPLLSRSLSIWGRPLFGRNPLLALLTTFSPGPAGSTRENRNKVWQNCRNFISRIIFCFLLRSMNDFIIILLAISPTLPGVWFTCSLLSYIRSTNDSFTNLCLYGAIPVTKFRKWHRFNVSQDQSKCLVFAHVDL